jgi:hypothetical protein
VKSGAGLPAIGTEAFENRRGTRKMMNNIETIRSTIFNKDFPPVFQLGEC